MRMFVAGPRVMRLRFGAIVSRRDLAMLFPPALWRVPLYLALGVVGFLATLFAIDFASYLPR